MAQSTGNTRLQQAKRNKKDEFYTQLSDIEKELYHYREHFNGKVVFVIATIRMKAIFLNILR